MKEESIRRKNLGTANGFPKNNLGKRVLNNVNQNAFFELNLSFIRKLKS